MSRDPYITLMSVTATSSAPSGARDRVAGPESGHQSVRALPLDPGRWRAGVENRGHRGDMQMFAAWPALNGFTGNPASSYISQSFSCGDHIVVLNECNGNSINTPITDHAGPDVACQMSNELNACLCDPKPRIVDLSIAAFVAIGNVTLGHITVTIYW
jgi:hypothetical protein